MEGPKTNVGSLVTVARGVGWRRAAARGAAPSKLKAGVTTGPLVLPAASVATPVRVWAAPCWVTAASAGQFTGARLAPQVQSMVSDRYQPLSPLGSAGANATVSVGGVRSTTTVATASGPVWGGRRPSESVSVARTRSVYDPSAPKGNPAVVLAVAKSDAGEAHRSSVIPSYPSSGCTAPQDRFRGRGVRVDRAGKRRRGGRREGARDHRQQGRRAGEKAGRDEARGGEAEAHRSPPILSPRYRLPGDPQPPVRPVCGLSDGGSEPVHLRMQKWLTPRGVEVKLEPRYGHTRQT